MPDALNYTWAGEPNSIWDETTYNIAENTPVFVLGQKFFAADQGTQFVQFGEVVSEISPYVVSEYVEEGYVEGLLQEIVSYLYVPVATILERVGLPIVREGLSAPMVIELIRGVYPVFEGVEGVVVNISIGVQQELKNPIEWEGPYEFEIGSDFFSDFFLSGRYVSIRYEANQLADWKLQAFELDAQPMGER